MEPVRPTCRVEEAMRTLGTRRKAMVEEEPETRIEAEVLVGVKTLVVKVSHEPGVPAEQAAEAVVTTPEPFSSRQRDTVRLFKVRSLVMVTAPLNLEVPSTPKVVVGRAVPMPTRFSLAFTTKVLSAASARSPP